MRNTLKRVFCSQLSAALSACASLCSMEVKQEPVLHATGHSDSGNGIGHNGGGGSGSGFGDSDNHSCEGEVFRCLICDSKYHWARQCPHAYENHGKSSKEEETDCVQMALFIGYTGEMDSFKLNSLVNESKVSAVLDTGCSTTVCGGQWLSEYLKTLSDYESSQIVEENSTRTFTFGDGKNFTSLRPVTFAVRYRRCFSDCDD